MPVSLGVSFHIVIELRVLDQHSFMVTDHKQSFPAEIALTGQQTPVSASTLWDLEEFSRAEMRLSIFPQLPQ